MCVTCSFEPAEDFIRGVPIREYSGFPMENFSPNWHIHPRHLQVSKDTIGKEAVQILCMVQCSINRLNLCLCIFKAWAAF